MNEIILPTNNLVCPLLTDMYQISMAYAYWKNNKHQDHAIFDLFFRINPFGGKYCIFAGIDEVLKFVSTFKFTESDIEYLRSIMITCEEGFFEWLATLNCSEVKLYAVREGCVVFPRAPLIRVEGPLAIIQLLETTLLNLVNYPSLITTNASRMRLIAGPSKSLLEFGLRRAQGPDGGLSASKYSYLGGFNGTSNVLAGKLFGIKISGTHAHSFVMSYTQLNDLHSRILKNTQGEEVDFVTLIINKRNILKYEQTTNEGELAAYIAYAQAFPNGFLALVDTYDTLSSGVLNFLIVGSVLYELGYKPIGIRLDSGDLASLSKQIRNMFRLFDETHIHKDFFVDCIIVASNDINEDVLNDLNEKGHDIDTFGIGTHLVTCQKQPALGCVYKLVEINNHPRIKLSNEIGKMIIPGKKDIYRLYGENGKPLLDLLLLADEPIPTIENKILVRHPFAENKRAYIQAKSIEPLLSLVYDGTNGGIQNNQLINLEKAKELCSIELASFGEPHILSAPISNKSTYKLSVSEKLFEFTHKLWMDNAPIAYIK